MSLLQEIRQDPKLQEACHRSQVQSLQGMRGNCIACPMAMEFYPPEGSAISDEFGMLILAMLNLLRRTHVKDNAIRKAYKYGVPLYPGLPPRPR